jgi:predicted MPP superfamily phosphohydrolase
MTPELAWTFWLLAASTFVGVPLYALRVRGRTYAIFGLVVLAVSLPGAVVMHGRLVGWLAPPFADAVAALFALHMAATGVHLAALVRPRLRSLPFRALVSIPGQAFLATGALSGVWLLFLLPLRALLAAAGFEAALALLRWLDLLPFAVAALSLLTSLRLPDELVRVTLGAGGPTEVARVPVERYRRGRAAPLETRPLRIVQIADPHLGPWQPVRRLRRRIEALVAHAPDLVLLTGDFLTMEGRGTPGALAEALVPLHGLRGRCFAILGNHDLEAVEEVRNALVANDVQLLEDDEASIETAVGRVQIVGASYVRRDRKHHIEALLARFPRRDDHLRLFLLHDPLGFQHVPAGDVDLTLSGHTHGGQLGLVSFGLDWTVLSRTRWPDHGLFARGSNRLYVHRGTGFYGFPLRVGVPGEASVLEVVRT